MKSAVDPSLPQPLVELIHEHRGHLSPAQRASGQQRLLARIQARQRWRARAALWAGVTLTSSVAAGVVGFAMLHRPPPVLGVAVTDAHLLSDGAIEPDTGKAPRLHFTDGSDVRLSSAAHASLSHIDDRGATVAVRDGNAEVDITHLPRARWVFEVGPFVIHVTGTAFRIAWNATNEEFDLRMQRGTVEVQGPLTEGMIALRAGQHLVVRMRRGEAVIREHEAEDEPGATASSVGAAAEHPSQEPAMAHFTDGGPAGGTTASAHRGDVGESWPSLLASGSFDAIVADAHRHGVDATLARAGSTELAALADAARYTRDDDVARRALLAERRRFPGSAQAREAEFLLGRLEETRNDSTAAIDWYRRYVAEDPSGRYVSEALGRTMVLLAAGSPDSARPVAEDYLQRFPSGAYAARARAIAKVP
jgi:TolA-binding protein